MKYAFIDEHRSGFRVKKMCRVLDISRSRYYAWRRRSKGLRQEENERLLEKIKEAYKIGRGTYGSPRIAKELRENGIPPVGRIVLPVSCGFMVFMPKQNADSG